MRKLPDAFQDSEMMFSVNLGSLTSSRDIDEQLLKASGPKHTMHVHLLTMTVVNLQF